jgi:hypothetical protein
MTKRTDIERYIDIIEDIVIKSCRRTFGRYKTTKNNKKENSVPWWNTHLTVMRKEVNAKRLFQRTTNDIALQERRKEKYKEVKREYQTEINKAKVNSWKEFCNVGASVKPWSQVYKIAAGKTKGISGMTTITKPDGTETTDLQETINEIIDHLYKEGDGEETPHHKRIRKAVDKPIHTEDDAEFTPEEIKRTIVSFSPKKAPGMDGINRDIPKSISHSPVSLQLCTTNA